jgi:hypothetical protein
MKQIDNNEVAQAMCNLFAAYDQLEESLHYDVERQDGEIIEIDKAAHIMHVLYASIGAIDNELKLQKILEWEA